MVVETADFGFDESKCWDRQLDGVKVRNPDRPKNKILIRGQIRFNFQV